MIFIFGGRCQGKLQYAKQLYGENLTVCDLKNCTINDAFSADIIINMQEAVKSLLTAKENPSAYFKENIEKFKDKIVIGDEIGCGIVPIDELEREWRDETGWVYQLLTQKAKRVDRVWAGIGQTLKNEK